ncbi:MAG TPA: D-glycero-beta-D-manno-heptose-7-phosphate kinase [Chlorobaculum sp.]|jgi:rfaE bifunctional protein kinase chain/domain|uniref:Carbohydrate kinase, PfkB family n=1 Tax=Chlorobaculum tepidum (strain ATCC 49652 / DSM 12025 / NBRC 103806 / TLS) TaxID=194439 RepID=Q8KD86_CHLTE|nr:D-glycero-beta-D-manno-heptose-7-phosphate kinase [Chlorobaculum tepidum]AAM72401.1 carbohydrate kinase, PfkB family [Chlorobaculum tepidum TLS]HBU23959.1 D-glycero-beta-D-manno-heptose-7-phosphate kinase [Chlorobaculum sp.]
MTPEKIEQIFRSFKEKKIAVIGDVMIDKYIFGHVSRISPEYPVPVVDVNRESSRLGGAANVAVNIHALGAEALLIGVTGDDTERRNLEALMTEHGLNPAMLAADSTRPTTCKTRILSQNHHITRVDYESRTPVDAELEKRLLGMFMEIANAVDAVVLEDYNKGVLTPSLIVSLIAACRERNKPVLVDPKLKGFFSYGGCSVFKPNLSELAASLGIPVANDDREVEQACLLLGEKLTVESLVVTRSEKGMTVYDGSFTHIPALSLDVADVSGAGDTVIGTLALGLASGLDLVTSTRIANLAANTVCQEVGAVPVRPDKLFSACLAHLQ